MSTLTRRAFGASLVAGAAAGRSSLRLRRRAASGHADRPGLAVAHRSRRARQGAPGVADRAGDGVPRAHRHLQPQAERVHHRHRASARWPGPRRSTPSSAPAPSAGRCTACRSRSRTTSTRPASGPPRRARCSTTACPSEDAEVARRLTAAGAIVLGKLNLHEFANGGTSATSYYGPVRNPWALDRNPGGSSGGSAAAVVGGAVLRRARHRHRRLDSHAGVVLQHRRAEADLRAGLDSRHHAAGVVARSLRADDAHGGRRGVMLQALAGYDRLDIASVEHPAEDYVAALAAPVKGLRVGVARGRRSSITSMPTS